MEVHQMLTMLTDCFGNTPQHECVLGVTLQVSCAAQLTNAQHQNVDNVAVKHDCCVLGDIGLDLRNSTCPSINMCTCL